MSPAPWIAPLRVHGSEMRWTTCCLLILSDPKIALILQAVTFECESCIVQPPRHPEASQSSRLIIILNSALIIDVEGTEQWFNSDHGWPLGPIAWLSPNDSRDWHQVDQVGCVGGAKVCVGGSCDLMRSCVGWQCDIKTFVSLKPLLKVFVTSCDQSKHIDVFSEC